MLLSRSKNSQSCGISSIAPSLGIKLFPEPANILRLVVHNWKHPAKKQQIARLYRLDISAKRCRCRWELDTELLQSAIRAALLRTFSPHHLPTCAPSSTCTTSPVTWAASAR